MSDTGRRLAALSTWYDEQYENPRLDASVLISGVEAVSSQILAECVALLTSWEHVHGNNGQSEMALQRYIADCHTQVGLPPIGANARQS